MMFSAMTEMASKFRNPWPVHYTTDTWDLSQADRYQEQGQYVWLMHQSIHIRDDFPLSWMPESGQEFNVHAFPYCKLRSKKVLRWDAMKLVPTNPGHRLAEVKQKLIAGYDRNSYSIFFVSQQGDEAASDKFQAHLARFPHAYHLKNVNNEKDICKHVLGKLFSKYAWLIDIDLVFNDEFELFYEPNDEYLTAFTWNTHNATELLYPTGGLRLVPYSYFKALGDVDDHLWKVVDNSPGKLNNARNPMQAYTSAFRETVDLFTRDFDNIDVEDVVDQRLSDSSHRLHKYIHRGISEALDLMEERKRNKQKFAQLKSGRWVRDRFRSGQQLF